MGEEAAAPEQRGVHAVDHGDPQRHDEQPRLELQSPDETAEKQDGRDRGEDELEVGERRGGKVEGYERIGARDGLALLGARGRQGLKVPDEAAPERARRPEVRQHPKGHVVAPEHPHDQRDREGRKDHQHRVDDPLLSNEAPVENGDARQAHQPDQRRGHELPRVVRRIQPVGIGDITRRSEHVHSFSTRRGRR